MFRQRIPKWQKYQWLQAIYNPLWTFLVTLTIGGLWNSDWGLRIPSRSSNKQSSNILINKFCTKTIWRQKGPKKWNNFCISFVLQISKYVDTLDMFQFLCLRRDVCSSFFHVVSGAGEMVFVHLFIKSNTINVKSNDSEQPGICNNYAQSLSRNKVCTYFLMRHVHGVSLKHPF